MSANLNLTELHDLLVVIATILSILALIYTITNHRLSQRMDQELHQVNEELHVHDLMVQEKCANLQARLDAAEAALQRAGLIDPP